MARSAVDKHAIIVGKPLPFSIYGADNKLLLAQGHVVKTEGMREALLRGGSYASRRDADVEGSVAGTSSLAREEACNELHSPIEKYIRDHAMSLTKWRPNLRMSREDGGESYATRIIGMHERASIILSAPMRADRTLVPVLDRQIWQFRALYQTSALRFQSIVLKTAFEPFPHLHVEVPRTVERKLVRAAPRVAVCVRATISQPVATTAVLVDMSLGGARLAADASTTLQAGQMLTCTVNLPLHQRMVSITLSATVLSRDEGDEQITGIVFHRVRFDPLDDARLLALEAFLNSAIAMESDSFWRYVSFSLGTEGGGE